jgi:hypothetical protein
MGGWNIFTGIPSSEVNGDEFVKKLRRCKRPLYLAIDIYVSKSSGEGGTYLHLIEPDIDVVTVLKTLATEIKCMKNFNDRAWVEGMRKAGTLDGIPIWKLELGS